MTHKRSWSNHFLQSERLQSTPHEISLQPACSGEQSTTIPYACKGPRQTANRFPRRNTSPDRRIPRIVAFPQSHGTSLMVFPESTSPPRIAATFSTLPASDPTGSPSPSMANDGGRHAILPLNAILALLVTPTTPTCPQQLRLAPATPTRPSNSDSAGQLLLLGALGIAANPKNNITACHHNPWHPDLGDRKRA